MTEAEVAGTMTAHLGHTLGGRTELLAFLAGVGMVMHGAPFRRCELSGLGRAADILRPTVDDGTVREWPPYTAV